MKSGLGILKLIILSVSMAMVSFPLQSRIEDGTLSVNVGVGVVDGSSSGDSFNLIVDMSSSATMIPDIECSSCKEGARYDNKLSSKYSPVECSSDYCQKGSISYCPSHHTSDKKCCDNHNRNLCFWDSSIQFNTKYPASGGIIRDVLTIGSHHIETYFVDVLDSRFNKIPGDNVGVLGIGEQSCNPTCIAPVYYDVIKSIHPEYTKQDMRISVCFGRTTGQLMFDEVDSSLLSSPIILSKQRKAEIGYTFDLQDLRMNNHSYTGLTALGLNRVVLLESTFSEIRLPHDLHQKYVDEMKKSYATLEGVSSGIVFSGMGIKSISGYPTFDLQIPGALLHLPPTLYFLKKEVEGVSLYYLQIVSNTYENTVQLGLAALRGFVTEFRYETVAFASVNREICGDDDAEAVGTVEWAHDVNKNSAFHPMFILSMVFCAAIIVLVIFMCTSQRKKKSLKTVEPSYEPTKVEPFRDTHEILIGQSI